MPDNLSVWLCKKINLKSWTFVLLPNFYRRSCQMLLTYFLYGRTYQDYPWNQTASLSHIKAYFNPVVMGLLSRLLVAQNRQIKAAKSSFEEALQPYWRKGQDYMHKNRSEGSFSIENNCINWRYSKLKIRITRGKQAWPDYCLLYNWLLIH